MIIFLRNIKGAISHSNAPILMSGQAYTVVVGINMPESPRNRDLGMFMSCLQIHSVNRKQPKQDEIIRVANFSSDTLHYQIPKDIQIILEMLFILIILDQLDL